MTQPGNTPDTVTFDEDQDTGSSSPYRRFFVSARVFEAACENYTEEQADIFRWVYHLAREQEWSMNHLGKITKIAASTFSKIFRGTYEADVESMARRLQQFREHWQANEGVDRPDFLFTSTADEIFFGCEKAATAKVVVLIHGPYGIGKTEALEEYQRRNNHGKTLYVRCPSNGGVTTFMREIARQIGENGKANADSLRHAIFQNIRKRAHLVIFDELHEIFLTGRSDMPVRWLEFIREIYDKCRCGIVLCGTQVLPDELRRGKFAKALAQLTDRGSGVEIALDPNIRQADLDLFFAHYDLGEPHGDAADIVRDILKAHSLRRLCFLLQDGQRLANKRNEKYAWKHFVTVHDTLAKLATPKTKAP